MVYQLTQGASIEEIKAAGLQSYYTEHGCSLFPVDSNGVPFTAAYFAATGDPVADIAEDMAAEQKARTTYDNILRMVDDPDVIDPIRYLREREIVHFQRFGEALRVVQDNLDCKNFYAINPEFDK